MRIGGGGCGTWGGGSRACVGGVVVFVRGFEFARMRLSDRAESDGVAGLELAHFPKVGVDDGGGADEPAEARAVGAEDDGEVAGEVDGADGVGVVVDVGRVQAGLAAVGAGQSTVDVR